MNRKETIRRRIKNLETELARLESMPDFDALKDGSVLAVALTYPGNRAYQYVALKVEGRWYFTGNGPDRATGEEVASWLTGAGRRVIAIEVIAELVMILNSDPEQVQAELEEATWD